MENTVLILHLLNGYHLSVHESGIKTGPGAKKEQPVSLLLIIACESKFPSYMLPNSHHMILQYRTQNMP